VGRYVTTRLGVEPGTALDTVLAIQLAHLPSPDRTMPQTLHLAHDYAAWYSGVLQTRAEDHREDWERFGPRLGTFPAAEIKIEDPNDVCRSMVGKPMMVMAWSILGWDMASPVARGHLVAPIETVRSEAG
jgi:hypothetical protein